MCPYVWVAVYVMRISFVFVTAQNNQMLGTKNVRRRHRVITVLKLDLWTIVDDICVIKIKRVEM